MDCDGLNAYANNSITQGRNWGGNMKLMGGLIDDNDYMFMAVMG
jgi:hypothetical protein